MGTLARPVFAIVFGENSAIDVKFYLWNVAERFINGETLSMTEELQELRVSPPPHHNSTNTD